MKPPLRVAIIGMGGFAGTHHESVLKLEASHHARLVATCDPQAASFVGEKGHWNLPRRGVQVFASYQEMLAACAHDLDVLVVPTPIPLHAEMHRAGVEARLGIYLEKPPTLDHLELERMIVTDQAAPKATLVGFNFIVEEARQTLKTRLLAGEFGNLLEAHLFAEWARPAGYFLRTGWAGRLRGSDGRIILDSCLGNAMAHYVHNLLFWAGADELHDWGRLETVQAELYRAHAIEGPDTVFVEARTIGGTLLRFGLTHACCDLSTQSETLICEKATIRYIVEDGIEIRWHHGRIETIRLERRDFVTANHLAYYRYLCGETARPETTLADSRAFVALNNLAYVSSGEITPLPADAVTRIRDARNTGDYLTVAGLGGALRDFLAQGRWPGAALGWRRTKSEIVALRDISRFHDTIDTLAAVGSRTAGAPMVCGAPG